MGRFILILVYSLSKRIVYLLYLWLVCVPTFLSFCILNAITFISFVYLHFCVCVCAERYYPHLICMFLIICSEHEPESAQGKLAAQNTNRHNRSMSINRVYVKDKGGRWGPSNKGDKLNDKSILSHASAYQPPTIPAPLPPSSSSSTTTTKTTTILNI